MLLDRVAQSFHMEAGAADDVAAQLFGREAEGGVRLLQLLDRKYAVVVTNPPYMGSGNMGAFLAKHVEQHYNRDYPDLWYTCDLSLWRKSQCLDYATIRSSIALMKCSPSLP
jgi:hypothetical protein